MNSLTLYVICGDNRQKGIEGHCHIDQYPHNGGWYAYLRHDINQWCLARNITFTSRVKSQWWAEFTFDGPRDAVLFKLTWL